MEGKKETLSDEALRETLAQSWAAQGPKSLKSKHDALFLLLHVIMSRKSFRLVGLGEDGPQVEEKKLPDAWNSTIDAFSFRYRHSQSSMLFFLKGLRLGDKLIIHAFARELENIQTFEINVNEFVNDLPSDVSNISSMTEAAMKSFFERLYKDIPRIVALMEKQIISKLLPTTSDVKEQEASSATLPSSGPRSPPGPAPAPDYDPLRIGPPRRPVRPEYGPPFGIGDDDLTPGGIGAQPFGPGWMGPGAPAHPRGGTQIGPHHPGFGPFVNDPYATDPRNGPFPGRGGPPGRRFDPYGPPGVNRPVPDPDHLRPPGPGPSGYFDDMFM